MPTADLCKALTVGTREPHRKLLLQSSRPVSVTSNFRTLEIPFSLNIAEVSCLRVFLFAMTPGLELGYGVHLVLIAATVGDAKSGIRCNFHPFKPLRDTP